MDGLVGRRAFLAGAAGAVVLAACGGDGGENGGGAAATTTSTGPDSGISVGLLASQFVAGREQRVAFVLLDDNRPLGEGTDVEVAFGAGPPQPAVLHADGIPTPYFLTSTTVARPGTVVMDVRVGGRTVRESPLDFVDEATVDVPLPGDRMVPVETPTPADHRGVEPICTSNPPCPLHDATLAGALGEGMPTAVLFATPALCQTRLCGPVLDLLVAEREAFAGRVRVVHVEVYTNLEDFQLTEGMKAYALTFEPVLYLAGADGIVRERLDGSYDRGELRAALGRLAASALTTNL